MDTQHIISELTLHHDAFIQKIKSLSDQDFMLPPNGKWSAAQQLEHIIKSVKPIDMAFGLPAFVLKMKFGLANRSSKSYEALVTKYKAKLEENKDFEMPKEYWPDEIPLKRKEKSLQKLEKLVQKLCGRLSKYTEEELDQYILPHPLLGKLTLREMLYFTIYHVQHHDKQILENLGFEH